MGDAGQDAVLCSSFDREHFRTTYVDKGWAGLTWAENCVWLDCRIRHPSHLFPSESEPSSRGEVSSVFCFRLLFAASLF